MIPYKLRKTSSENKEWSEPRLLEKCKKYCSQAERCQHDVISLLNKYSSNEQLKHSILNALIDENYVNETRYCQAYVHDKVAFQQWGRSKIKQGLLLKHLPQDIVENTVENLNESEYFQNLKNIINKRADDDPIRLKKYLLQRGFTYDDINRVLKD